MSTTAFLSTRQLIREGAWWDLVEPVATNLLGIVLLNSRNPAWEIADTWINQEEVWLRRTAIISQLRHRDQTDAAQLFEFCRARAHEKEFFIRKVIGWALRQYSKWAPDAVLAFLQKHGNILSGLSYREASKHLKKTGSMLL